MDKIKRMFDESLTNDDVFMVCATVDTGNLIVVTCERPRSACVSLDIT